MRKSTDLDRILENAVAAAIGVPKPHLSAPKKLRVASRALHGRRTRQGIGHRDHGAAA